MKTKWILLASLALVVTLALSACDLGATTPAPAPRPAGQAQGLTILPYYPSQQTGLWVNGEGKVTFAPDIAILSLGIESQEKTVAQAQEKARQTMDKVLAALAAKGVAKKDIKTQQFSIQPVTTWVEPLPTPQMETMPGYKPPPREVIIGYRVTNQVTAKIRQIEQAGPVIDAVAGAGGDLTRIQSIGFTVDAPAPLRIQARENAIKDAVAKAEQMARLTGVKLGKPIYVTEGGGYVPQPMVLRAEAFAGAAPASTPHTSIEAGEMEMTVNVQIVYAILE